MVVKGFVVFIFADAQAFTGGEHHIISTVPGNIAGIDQIRFVDAQKLTILLAKACFHHVELLVKCIAVIGGNDMGAPSFGSEISNLIDGDVEILRSDIV